MQNKYPLWKNALLVFIVFIGFLYALPNIYSEDPVLQISSSAIKNDDSLLKDVSNALSKDGISSESVLVKNNNVEVRFKSTDTQLLARDKLKKTLGDNYTIALNLLPSTPPWLLAIGASPMKQGLDLRGGVHFLLEVDVDSVIGRRYEGLMRNIGQELREMGIRYTGIRNNQAQGITIRFKYLDDASHALDEIKRRFPELDYKLNDSNYALNVVISANEINNIRQNTIDQTMSILRNRVNELGVGEAVVQQQGATRVSVDLPGILDAVRAKEILGGTATLQFYLVDQDNDAMLAKKTGAVPVNSKLYTMNGYPILLKRQVVLSGDSITSAVSSFDQQTASPAVSIQLGGGGEVQFTKVTRENIGKHMAIVYVESKTSASEVNGEKKLITHRDERIISAPVIQSALGNNFQITGLTDSKEASDLALLLRAGALPAAIYPIEERTVGPSLGKENIRRGILSLEVGMGLILLLMLVYYRLFGLVANIAIFLNLILLCAVLSLIGATLTLPGIAGIVLTIGMAVDANVLIDERIREELRNGMSSQAAIHAGYERAFATILDANLTTMIVALILFSIGTGPIKGFAITLSLGLITSMLTGVTYTRAIINLVYGNRKINKLSIGI